MLQPWNGFNICTDIHDLKRCLLTLVIPNLTSYHHEVRICVFFVYCLSCAPKLYRMICIITLVSCWLLTSKNNNWTLCFRAGISCSWLVCYYWELCGVSVLVQALVILYLNYCNLLLAGLPSCAGPAQLVLNLPKFPHTTLLLHNLHWLPVAAWIWFTMLVLAYHGLRPILHP